MNKLILIVALIVLVGYILISKEGYQSLAEQGWPLGISTVRITPNNHLVKMPYDMGHTLSTDSCLSACSTNLTRPNILLGKGVFSNTAPAPNPSSTNCVMACST
jgi:hypothetical protein